MNTTVLFRKSLDEEKEFEVCKEFFDTVGSRMQCGYDSLVIGRYSVLPFYQELEDDLRLLGSRLINSFTEHTYIADLKNWYEDLKDFTPKTWFRLEDIPDEGPFVLKGATNSRKHLWNTHMYASNKKEAVQVYSRLMDDTMLSQQGIYIRRFVPLRTLMTGINGLPITEEFRLFCYRDEIVTSGFYWSSHVQEIEVPKLRVDQEFVAFTKKLMAIIKDHVNFYVMDIARCIDGSWLLVEINDAQQSGLSECSSQALYHNLAEMLNAETAPA